MKKDNFMAGPMQADRIPLMPEQRDLAAAEQDMNAPPVDLGATGPRLHARAGQSRMKSRMIMNKIKSTVKKMSTRAPIF